VKAQQLPVANVVVVVVDVAVVVVAGCFRFSY